MSNDSSGNPWVLDTAGTVTVNLVIILAMEWVPSAAADDLTIIDNNSKTIWDADALTGGTAGKEKFPVSQPFLCSGFEVSVIDGGTLYVWLG